MATLEKIRSKSVFLLVVIFVALLAFILGDAITNGRNLFGNHTTVAKVGGDKIDYLEYQRKREELAQQLEEARKQNPQQYANFDQQRLPQMALNQLISEHLLNDAVSRLGIRTSGAQLREYLFNSQPTPDMIAVVRQLQSMGVNVASIEQAHSAIFNPKANGLTQAQVEPLQKAWLAIEADAKKQLAQSTYVQLLAGTFHANNLDKKALYNDYVALTDVSYAYRPYGQLDEKKYPVSDAEIKKAYDEDKNMFRVEEPTKDVSFIAVSVAPSQADLTAAAQLADKTAVALRDTAASLPKSLKDEGIHVENKTLRGADISNGAVKAFVASAPKDSVSVVSNNMAGFTIVKMGKRYAEVDSVKLNLVTVAGKTLPAKVLARLNGGLALDSLASTFAPDSVVLQADQWITLFNDKGRASELSAAQLDTLKAANGRFVKMMSTADGALLAQLASQSSPKEIYEYDVVEYTLQPSAKTLSDERAKLEKFLAANTTAAAFTKNAEKEGYNVQNYQLSQSSDAVPRMPNYPMYFPESRQVVRWVMMDGKPGQVSHVYESNDKQHPMLYAVAVNSAYEDFVPVTNADVKEYLTQKVRRSKAGDAMMKEYAGKTANIATVARAMGVEPTENPQLRFQGRAGINDPKVLGQMVGAKPGQKVVLVKGDDGVYAYVVKGHSNEKLNYDDATYEQQYRQLVNPQLELMLRGAKKIDNNIYKFEAGD